MIHIDPWLDRWISLLGERSGDRAVLELGCGTGRDTATLDSAGFRVIAIDLSCPSLLAAKARVPNAEFHCQNILDPFPVEENGTGVIVASLSLHYFPWADTLNLVQRIRQTLRPEGILLCRLNSTNDKNFGATGHERIAENYYLVNGHPKRFFDRESVNNLFLEGWNVLNIEEVTINRYALPKIVWEIVLERRE